MWDTSEPSTVTLPRSLKIFAKDEFLGREGWPGREWFVLVRGSVGVYKQEIKLDTFDSPGTIFGEISGILGTLRSASLMALVDTEVICLPNDLDELIKSHPEIAKKIIVNLAERLVKTTDSFIAKIS